MYWEDIFFLRVLPALVALIFIWAVAAGVMSARIQKSCLDAGYPKSEMTWDFEGYCLNLEGVVTGKVEKLQ